jgi:tellurite methyltransferase
MKKDRIKWNRKHFEKPRPGGPTAIVETYAPLASTGRALDIAAGLGRNSIFLAQRGFDVEAVDISDAALGRYAGAHPRLRAICADLDVFDIPARRYDLIINIRFLQRRLFPQIMEGLAPGGMLVFETWIHHPEDPSEKPVCRDFLLRENELLHAFLPLRTLYYREAEQEEGGRPAEMASLVGIKKR